MSLITQPPASETAGLASHCSDAPTCDPLLADSGNDEPREPGRKRRSVRRRRHVPPEQTLWRSKSAGQPLATVLLAVLIIGAPQLLGGVTYWAVQLIAWMSLVCFGVLIWRAPAAVGRFSVLGLALLGMALWTCVQAMPLPCRLVGWLAPDSAAAAYDVARLVQQETTCRLTLGPANTQVEIVKAIIIFATFNACWLFAASGGRRRLLWMIASSTLAISTIALVHYTFGISRVFGVYQPKGLTPTWPLSPLMNPNNMGGFAALGVPLWIGLLHHASDSRARIFGYVAVAITAAVAVLSLSRGAIGQLIVSVLVMVWLLLRDRRVRRKGLAEITLREVYVVTAIAVGVGLSALFVGESVLREFRTDNYDKLTLTGRAFHFAWQHGLTGVGRGAFASAFLSETDQHIRFRYAENFVAQWIADWGIPMGCALLVGIVWALRAEFKHPKESLARFGAYVALISWAAQNLVDFGFELCGIAVVASALLAACVAPSRDVVSETAVQTGKDVDLLGIKTLGVAAFVFSMLGVAYFGASIREYSLATFEGRLRVARERADRTQFASVLKAGLSLHPREPTLVLAAAAESLVHKDPGTLRWLNRAMQLAPGWARSHELAYLWLWQSGLGEQALLELRTTAELDWRLALEHVCRLGAVEARWALDVVPLGEGRQEFLERVSACISHSEASQVFDDVVLQEFPGALAPLIHQAQRFAADGRGEESLLTIDRARRAHPEWLYGIIARLDTLLGLERFQDVLDEVQSELPRQKEAQQIALLERKARALNRMDQPEMVQSVLADIRRRSSENSQRLASSYLLEAALHKERREFGQALSAYREAYRISSDVKTLRAVGLLAESLGERSQALWAYVTLCQRVPGGDDCERRNALLQSQPGKARSYK